MKLGGARCIEREGCISISVAHHPLPGAARGRPGAGGRGSCRVDEHFSHFFFILTRIVFKKGFVIIASVHPIMLAYDKLITNYYNRYKTCLFIFNLFVY